MAAFDLRVESKEKVETVNVEEPRFKVLAEELSNNVGKKILQLLLSRALTIAQTAEALNESIQMVKYHIDRMLDAEIIQVVSYEKSSKGKGMRKYGMRKTRILFVIKPMDKITKEDLRPVRRTALKRFGQRVISAVVAFGTFYLGGDLIVQQIIQNNPDNSLPGRDLVIGNSLMILPYLLGITAGLTMYYVFFWKLLSMNKGLQENTWID